ncbi:hypothetical protein N9Y79_00770 [Alphaproteobacteria bacterium]|nr:hypothetical protein [Alphaproteobacteria bacterium]MDB2641057.1 hypothetical protein [Alphaproteobacteria bacterium]
MSNLAFDTHKFVTDLNKAVMETAVAEVLADTYASLMNDRIATKDDLALLEERLNTSIIATKMTGTLATCAIPGFLMVFLQA